MRTLCTPSLVFLLVGGAVGALLSRGEDPLLRAAARHLIEACAVTTVLALYHRGRGADAIVWERGRLVYLTWALLLVVTWAGALVLCVSTVCLLAHGRFNSATATTGMAALFLLYGPVRWLVNATDGVFAVQGWNWNVRLTRTQ